MCLSVFMNVFHSCILDNESHNNRPAVGTFFYIWRMKLWDIVVFGVGAMFLGLGSDI